MITLSIIVTFLLIAILFLMLSLRVRFDVLDQPDGKYLVIWYNSFTRYEVKREHKLIKL